MLADFYKYISSPSLKDRLFFVRVIVCTGFISGLIISQPLWMNDRFYPLVPVADFIPVLSPFLSTILYFSMLMILGILIFYPKKYVFGSFFCLMVYAVLQDQSRLQPWVYQYYFILASVCWFQSTDGPNTKKHALGVIQILVIGIYIWSGLHKFNYIYLNETFEWLIGPIITTFPSLSSLPLASLALLTAVIETCGGVSLIFRSTRAYGAWILIGMHIFILFVLGPAGIQFNNVIWPWNICFIMLLYVLFLRTDKARQPEIPLIPKSIAQGVIILLFLLMPALSFAGSWDYYTSASLYTGKTPYAKIHVTQSVKEKFPEKVQTKFSLLNELSIGDWSYSELNVPDYPQPRIYKGIFQELCKYQQHKYGLVLEIYDAADLFTGKRERNEYFCHELAESKD